MATAQIKVSSVKENQYGLSIGYKQGDLWTNYYCNDKSLFGMLNKGDFVTVEYMVNKGGNNVITGVTPQNGSTAPNGASTGLTGAFDNPVKTRSIELQTIAKAWGIVQTGNEAMTPSIFASDVLAIHELLMPPLAAMVEKAKEVLGAKEEPNPFADDPDNDIPFG